MAETKQPKQEAAKGVLKILTGKNELLLVAKGNRKVKKGAPVNFTPDEWKALPEYYKSLFTDPAPKKKEE
jgi:hypothetical protein